MGHRGYVIARHSDSSGTPYWDMWYTHWGALLKYDTPENMKIPLPMSPAESLNRPTFADESDNYVFLRTQWPTTYETSTEYVGKYNEEGEKIENRRVWDNEKEIGRVMDYYEEAHWETTSETCPHCDNREERIQRTLRYCANKNLTTFHDDYSNILLVYENGIYYVCWYDTDGGINRFERDKQRISKGEYSLIASDPKKYDYLLYEFLPFHGIEALKYDCPVCRGSGRKYWNIGTSIWLGSDVDDMFPPVPEWRKEYERQQGQQANAWYMRKDARISRHDVLAHSYWGLAWRAETRHEAADFGNYWDEDKRDKLTKTTNEELVDFLQSPDPEYEIENGMGYQVLNAGFNKCAPHYYEAMIAAVKPADILTIPKWSVYGASYTTTIFAINYPMGKNVFLDYRMPRNALPQSFITLWEKAKVEFPGYFNI